MHDAIMFAIWFPALVVLTVIITVPAINLMIYIGDAIAAKFRRSHEHHD